MKLRTCTVEVIAIGDELLRGIVQESNAHWIAKRVAARGASMTRITTLPDDPPTVADEIRAAIARGPTLLVTHGGLGPTDDDRTRAIVALALGVQQQRDPIAESIVRRRYVELAEAGVVGDAGLTPARLRMADLPVGARALDNHVGAAPGFWATLEGTTLVSLPGVPPELVWIWEHPLAPILDEVLGPGGFAEQTLTIELRDESLLAEPLERIAASHPSVYLKSRAKGFGDDDLIRVTAHAVGDSDADAGARVERVMREVRALIDSLGVAVTDAGSRAGQ